MLFISSKKLFWFSNLLSILSIYYRLKGSNETGIIMTPWIGLYKFTNVIFGVTQKPHCINFLEYFLIILFRNIFLKCFLYSLAVFLHARYARFPNWGLTVPIVIFWLTHWFSIENRRPSLKWCRTGLYRALTRKLQLGPSGPNWESER